MVVVGLSNCREQEELVYIVRDFIHHFVTAYNAHEGRLSIRGLVLVNAEHRLIPHPPGMISWKTYTVDLFRFVATLLNDRLDEAYSDQATRNSFPADTNAIGVGGTSAGSLGTFLACIPQILSPKESSLCTVWGRSSCRPRTIPSGVFLTPLHSS